MASTTASSAFMPNFYPRPPRGGRPIIAYDLTGKVQFLSTPSARRATRSHRQTTCASCDFYPRPPRGGRQGGIDMAVMAS